MAYKRKTVSEMSREFNCSEDDILKYLRRLGFHYVNRDSYVREDAYLSARKELSKSKSISEMSREFNCSEDDILEYLRRLGFHYVNRDSYVREDVYLSIKEEFSKPKLIEKPAPKTKKELAQKNLPVPFDYKPILAEFNLSELEDSPIKYFNAVLSVSDKLLDVLQELETAQADTIAESLQIALKLNAKYVDNPNLTAEENSLLAERQKFLSKRLELNTDEPKLKILFVKAQAEKFFERLDKINEGDNSICELAELKAESRVDFKFLVENLERIITAAQNKIKFFIEHKDLVANIVDSQYEWTDSYKAFKTSLYEELFAICCDNNIDEEIFSKWYDDWQEKRFAIEQRFMPLVEFALKGNLNDSFGRVIDVLQSYRDSVDKFYLHERKNIYQKFAFMAGGDLQEKFETESEFYKLAEKLQRDLQEIIFSTDKTETRIFILRWSEPLLNLPIDAISDFIREKELDAISKEILTQFAELRQKNFAMYIADSKAYSKAIQQREKDYNALIFNMRKGLAKK